MDFGGRISVSVGQKFRFESIWTSSILKNLSGKFRKYLFRVSRLLRDLIWRLLPLRKRCGSIPRFRKPWKPQNPCISNRTQYPALWSVFRGTLRLCDALCSLNRLWSLFCDTLRFRCGPSSVFQPRSTLLDLIPTRSAHCRPDSDSHIQLVLRRIQTEMNGILWVLKKTRSSLLSSIFSSQEGFHESIICLKVIKKYFQGFQGFLKASSFHGDQCFHGFLKVSETLEISHC